MYIFMATKHFNDANFEQEVLQASQNKPVLVDFFAEWCGPCKIQGPIVDELANDMEEKAIVGKLNTEEAGQTAQKYNVMSIPTILLFKDGEIKESFIGVQAKESLKEALEKYL
jgi:thioredoxin 1